LKSRAISLRALRLDLDVDRDCLAYARDCLGGWSKHKIEITSVDRIDRYSPSRSARLVERCKQFHMERDRLGHTVYGEIAKNIAALRTGSLYAAAFERHLGEFFDIKEFRAAQMIVSLFDPCVDAAHVNLRRNRGILRMLAVDVDLAIELRELSVSGA